MKLIRDLLALGWEVVLPVEKSWEAHMESFFGDKAPRLVRIPSVGNAVLGGILCVARLRRMGGDVLLIANVGQGLMPMIRLLIRGGRYPKRVLIAHREASPKFVALCARINAVVVAVNHVIARPFRAAGLSQVSVDYGVMDGEAFYPSGQRNREVNFCVVGMLDNAWKGADTAVAAFRALPEDLRSACVLHLASYQTPPQFPEANIRAYAWFPHAEMPAFLRNMDVMVVPSRDEVVMRETFSQAVVQGMLTGLPVVVSDLPILTSKLDQGGGMVCTSVPEFTAAFEGLARDGHLRQALGDTARATALERYLWDTARFVRRYVTNPDETGTTRPPHDHG